MNEWKNGLPTEEGNFWFYGWSSDFNKRKNPPEMVYMVVHKGVNSLFYVANGQFYYKKDAIGKHKVFNPPEPPEL